MEPNPPQPSQLPGRNATRTRPGRRGLLRIIAINVTLLALGAIVLLALGEIFIRRLHPGIFESFVADASLGWRVAPQIDFSYSISPAEGGLQGKIRVRTDIHGYRLGRPGLPKAEGAFRIAVIGDSFTFGATIHEDHLFTNVLDRTLAAAASRPTEVINLGVPGYGLNELHTMAAEALDLQPDLILAALYLGNDLQETLGLVARRFDPALGKIVGHRAYNIVNGQLVQAVGTAAIRKSPGGVKAWIRKHSRLYAVLADQLKSSSRLTDVFRRVGLISTAPPPARLPEKERLQRLWSGVGMVSLLRQPPPALDQAWSLVLQRLDEMQASCQARGVEFAVIHIPYKVQIVDTMLAEEMVLLGLSSAEIDSDRPNQQLLGWGESRDVPVLDLTPTFRRAPDRQSLYYLIDSHWSDLGQRLAGESISGWLLEQPRLLQRLRPDPPPPS